MTQELLHKYFKGDATVEEEKRILNWVDESEENRKTLQKERMLFDIALFTNTKANNKRGKAAMGTRILPMLRWSARIAAVIVVAVSCGFLFKEYHYGKEAHLQTVAVPAGQRAQITLADGTKVWLNAQSTLSYSHDFGRNERDVELDGEAYFEVAKNPEKKFVVSTSHQSQIEVLGTHFNVEAYEKEDRVSATLVEGKIGFIFKRDNVSKKVLMKPGQKLVYDFKDSKVQLYTTSGESEIAWKEGKIIFKDTPLEESLRMLEKRYNVEFIIKNERLKKYSFTGTFTHQRLERILEYFKISSRIRWRYIDSADIKDEKSRIEIY